jgi:hypothetical protein
LTLRHMFVAKEGVAYLGGVGDVVMQPVPRR